MRGKNINNLCIFALSVVDMITAPFVFIRIIRIIRGSMTGFFSLEGPGKIPRGKAPRDGGVGASRLHVAPKILLESICAASVSKYSFRGNAGAKVQNINKKTHKAPKNFDFIAKVGTFAPKSKGQSVAR